MRYLVLLLFLVPVSCMADQLDSSSSEATITSAAAEGALKIARTLTEQGKYEEALPYFSYALEENSSDIQGIFEYANALNALNHSTKALSIYVQLLKKRPQDSSILYNIAYTLKSLGYITDAMPFYEATLRYKPDNAEAHFSLGLAYLVDGNFKKGWPEYEWRWKRNAQLTPRTFAQPAWDGSCLDNKIIFLHAEQGLGDTLQFIRYAKFLKEKYRGLIIIVAVQKPLFDLISRCCPYIDKVITLDQIPMHFDFHAPLLSLPYIIGTDIDTIPTPIPYITADPALVAEWGTKLAQDTNFKVGICWQGNNQYSTPFLRAVVAAKSISLASFAPLARIPGVSLYSLQRETGTEQLASSTSMFKINIFDDHFDKDHGRFMDTAAVMHHLDLIITIDTSIAHLAGAMGKRVWLLLPTPPDWRWMLNRSDSPWYPQTMRLFRQSEAGHWAPLIQAVLSELHYYLNIEKQPEGYGAREIKKQEKLPHKGLQKLKALGAVTKKVTDNDPLTLFETKLQHHPHDAHTHYEYGTYLAQLDKAEHYPTAWHHLKQAITLKPSRTEWLFHYGTFCCRIGKFQEALTAYRTVLERQPTAITALYNSGYTFKLAGQYDTAIAIYKKIVAQQPDYEAAHLALAFALLSSGNFVEGWKEHAWNLRHQGKNGDTLRALVERNTVGGKTVLLTAEGGLGDTIHFVRYAQRLHAMGARTIVAVQPPLLKLLAGCPFINHLVSMQEQLPPCDAHATLMSLPAIFGDTEESMPRSIPYIFPPAERCTYWQKQLISDTNIKIGIYWQPDIHNDISRLPIARRGIPLAQFFSLGSLPGVTLYSLQRKEGLEQLENLPPSVNLHLFDETFDVKYGSFIDTAAVMENLDLIITTDTAIAHLAGALGKRTWLLLPYAPDWRWLHERIDSPWYPTMRIFKQPAPFDWDTVMQKVLAVFKKEILLH